MPQLPDPAAPSGYIAYHALAFTSEAGAALAAGPDTPLPVAQSLIAAAAEPLAGSASASAVLGPFAPDLGRAIWLTLSGTWSGSARIMRSIDGGTTKHPLTIGGEPWGLFTGNACEAVGEETEDGAAWYLDVKLLSGTLAYRVAQ